MSAVLKFLFVLIAIVGVAAIAWYLLLGGADMVDEMQMRTVKVDRTETDEPAKPAETAESAAPAATPMPAPAEVSAIPADELAAMTPEQFAEQYNNADVAVRAALITDFVRAAGEEKSLDVVRKFSSGPVEQRNYDLSYSVAQVTVVEHDSRLGSYIAGTMAMSGRGTDKDYDTALRYLRHPELLDTPNALYYRATILGDPEYAGNNKQAAIDLLKKVIELSEPGDARIEDARKLMSELGGS